jgi:hypothetical protein
MKFFTLKFLRHPVCWTFFIYSRRWRCSGVEWLSVFFVELVQAVGIVSALWFFQRVAYKICLKWRYKFAYRHFWLTFSCCLCLLEGRLLSSRFDLVSKKKKCFTNTTAGRHCFIVNRVYISRSYVWQFIVISMTLNYNNF